MKKDDFGNRMKEYENAFRHSLPRRLPIIVRIDGCHFHSFTRGMKKPFDETLTHALWEISHGSKIIFKRSFPYPPPWPRQSLTKRCERSLRISLWRRSIAGHGCFRTMKSPIILYGGSKTPRKTVYRWWRRPIFLIKNCRDSMESSFKISSSWKERSIGTICLCGRSAEYVSPGSRTIMAKL